MRKKLAISHHSVTTVDLSNPKKINNATTSVVKNRKIVSAGQYVDSEVFEIRKERALKEKSKLESLMKESYRVGIKTFVGMAILNAMMAATSHLVMLLVISAIVHGLTQCGFLAVDLYTLKKMNSNNDILTKNIRFISARIVKNVLACLLCVVIAFQLNSPSMSKWILPLQILLVLYFVVIIYFVISTGKLSDFARTLLFNMLVFIELFFVQKDADIIPRSQIAFLQNIWIYYVIVSVYSGASLFYLYRFLSFYGDTIEGRKSRVFLSIAVDCLGATCMTTTAIVHINSEVYTEVKISGLIIGTVLGAAICVASHVSLKRKQLWIDDCYKAIASDIDAELAAANKQEEMLEEASVPFYLVRLTVNYYKAADKYDLLKLATHRKLTSRDNSGSDVNVLQNELREDMIKAEITRKLELEENPPLQNRSINKKEPEVNLNDLSTASKSLPKRVYLFSSIKNKFSARQAPPSTLTRFNNEVAANSQRSNKYEKGSCDDTNTVKSESEAGGRGPSKRPTSIESSNSTQCCVCFDNAQTCVMMPCGHGGICMNCGIDVWTNSTDCYICKQTVESLLEIDPVPVANMCRVKNTILKTDQQQY